MKKQAIAALLALSIGSTCPAFLFAHGDMSPADREKKMDKMASELNLTQDQKNQIRTIKEDKYRKIEDLEKNADSQIRGVLNPDQQAKFDKMKEKHHS